MCVHVMRLVDGAFCVETKRLMPVFSLLSSRSSVVFWFDGKFNIKNLLVKIISVRAPT